MVASVLQQNSSNHVASMVRGMVLGSFKHPCNQGLSQENVKQNELSFTAQNFSQ